MSVCDFVKQVNVLKGRGVNVRGTLTMFDTDPEGATPDYLVATCPGPKRGIIRVKIEYPDVWFLKNPPKGFRVEKESFLQAHRVVMSTLKDGRVKDRYIATIVGQAYAPPLPSAPPPGLHVTPEGSYDAGIIIEGIYDVKVPAQ
jgi:hypothetical protein